MNNVVVAGDEAHHDQTGSKIGMWLFLFTELLLFGGLFLVYAVYRSKFADDFHFAATHLSTAKGLLNTVVLLTSSLLMVLSVAAVERGQRRLSAVFLISTILCGFIFMVVKYFEWTEKIHHGLYPKAAELVQHTPGENIFYGLYYGMTGLHGLHVIVGVIILSIMLYQVLKKPTQQIAVTGEQLAHIKILDQNNRVRWQHDIHNKAETVLVTMVYEEHEHLQHKTALRLENAGLYWHLVDIIWIFLFPLLYLIT